MLNENQYTTTYVEMEHKHCVNIWQMAIMIIVSLMLLFHGDFDGSKLGINANEKISSLAVSLSFLLSALCSCYISSLFIPKKYTVRGGDDVMFTSSFKYRITYPACWMVFWFYLFLPIMMKFF